MTEALNAAEIEDVRAAAQALIATDLRRKGLLGAETHYTVENVPAWYLYGAAPDEFVDRAFRIILRRAPTSADITSTVRQLDEGGVTRSQLLISIARSEESLRLKGQKVEHLEGLVVKELLRECASTDEISVPSTPTVDASELIYIPNVNLFVILSYLFVFGRLPSSADVLGLRRWLESRSISRLGLILWMMNQPDFDADVCRIVGLDTFDEEHKPAFPMTTTSMAMSLIASDLASLRQGLNGILRLAARDSGEGPEEAFVPPSHESPLAGRPDLVSLRERILTELDRRYRGDENSLHSQMQFYVPYLSEIRDLGPVLDIGCGRGTFLEILRSHDISAVGLEINEAQFEECQARRLNVRLADALAFMRNSPDGQYGAVTLFHVIEHLSFEVLTAMLQEAHRVLVPGGVLIMETPNSDNLYVSMSMFNVDPTHVKPITYQYISTVIEVIGFASERLPVNTLLHEDVGGETGNRHLDYILSLPANLSVLGRKS